MLRGLASSAAGFSFRQARPWRIGRRPSNQALLQDNRSLFQSDTLPLLGSFLYIFLSHRSRTTDLFGSEARGRAFYRLDILTAVKLSRRRDGMERGNAHASGVP